MREKKKKRYYEEEKTMREKKKRKGKLRGKNVTAVIGRKKEMSKRKVKKKTMKKV